MECWDERLHWFPLFLPSDIKLSAHENDVSFDDEVRVEFVQNDIILIGVVSRQFKADEHVFWLLPHVV